MKIQLVLAALILAVIVTSCQKEASLTPNDAIVSPQYLEENPPSADPPPDEEEDDNDNTGNPFNMGDPL